MMQQKNVQQTLTSAWVLLPLRLFLGLTFVYAGIQKLTDPQFFNPKATGYIGRQIIGFAANSPLQTFMLHFVAPHPTFFGILIAYGEIAIGLGALFGLLFRLAAFFGMLLSILFFLTASWHVYPYFYGSDIVFTFSWLTLLLNGPLNTGLPTIDELLTVSLLQSIPLQEQKVLTPILAVALGTIPHQIAAPKTVQPQPAQAAHSIQRSRYSTVQRARETRRSFLYGVLTGSIGFLSLAALAYAVRILQSGSDDAARSTIAQQPPTPISTSTTSGTTPSTSGAIAQVSAVPSNSAVNFTIPSTNDPGVLVHLDNGQFVAYDALCTHAGCQVDYDPSSKLLLCPCHGAAFDPAKQAQVVNPPANTPLAPVAIHIDSATGAITLA